MPMLSSSFMLGSLATILLEICCEFATIFLQLIPAHFQILLVATDQLQFCQGSSVAIHGKIKPTRYCQNNHKNSLEHLNGTLRVQWWGRFILKPSASMKTKASFFYALIMAWLDSCIKTHDQGFKATLKNASNANMGLAFI